MKPIIPKPIDFDSGLEFIIKTIEIGKEKPIIVTITGQPNSGKTRLKKQAFNILFSKDIFGWSGMSKGQFDEHMVKMFPEPSYVLIEDVGPFQGTDNYCKRIFDKLPDLRVYIYKKFIPGELMDLKNDQNKYNAYGLIIENPDARIK